MEATLRGGRAAASALTAGSSSAHARLMLAPGGVARDPGDVPCILCSAPHTVGVLCTRHAVAIASPGLTSEQILARTAQPTACLVDAWGSAHGIADGATLGRDRDRNTIAVLHASVSAEHASLRLIRGTWRIVDRASRNGTLVDGERVTDAPIEAGQTLRLGEVAFYFWHRPLEAAPPRGQGRTARAQEVEGYRASALLPGGETLLLLERTEDGVLRAGETTIELATMEFGLVRLLLERRRQIADPEFAYLAWHEIADALTFRSIDTDADNVRELVHRVRKKLGALGALVESKRGVGYRIAARPM